MIKNKKTYIAKRFSRELILNKHFAVPGTCPLILVLDHLRPDFNVGKIFRTAQFFSLQEIHLIGMPFIDPIPAKGAFRKVPARFFKNIDQCLEKLTELGHQAFCFDLQAKEELHQLQLPLKSAFIFGHEEFGLSFDPKDYPQIRPTKIPGNSGMQSLNVSIAAGMGAYQYMSQHFFSKTEK